MEVDPQAASLEEGAPVDEAASAPSEATGAPAPTQPEGFIEQKRYDELRAEFDRKNSLLDRALRGDAQAAEELGFEFAGEEQDPDLGNEEEEDPLTALQQQQQALAAWAQQREAQESQQRFNSDLDSLLGEKKISISEFERQGILQETIKRGDGFDALKAVVEDLASQKQAERNTWLDSLTPQERAKVMKGYQQSKSSTYVSPGGTGATETPYRDDMSIRELTRAAEEQFRIGTQG